MSSGCQSTERTKADQSRTLWAHPVRHQPQATALVPCSCCHFSLSPHLHPCGSLLLLSGRESPEAVPILSDKVATPHPYPSQGPREQVSEILQESKGVGADGGDLHCHSSMPSLTSPFLLHRDNTRRLPSGGPTLNSTTSFVRDPHGSPGQCLSHCPRGCW